MWQPIQRLLVLCMLALGILYSHDTHASDTLIVRQLNVDDGLSQGAIRDVFQDSYGLVWLATESGINRYDGHEFTRFTQAKNIPAIAPLIATSITSIGEDKYRRIWIASSQGIAVYQPQSNQFSALTTDSNKHDAILPKNVTAVLRHSDGTMWIATHAGLYSYSYQSKRFTAHHPESGLGADNIMRLAETPDGLLLLGTHNKGVVLFNPASKQFSSLYYQSNPVVKVGIADHVNEIHALFFDSSEQLWIGTNQGLIKYDYYNRKKQGDVLAQLQLDKFERQRIRSINQDHSGNIWVAIYGEGILSLDPRSNAFKLYRHQPAIRHSLNSNAVETLFFDSSGLLWIGSQSDGIGIWDPGSRAFNHIVHQPGNPQSLSDNIVWAIEEDQQGVLWVGTNQGLNRISADHQIVERFFTADNGLDGPAGQAIYNIQSDDQDNTLWLTGVRGLNHFDPHSGIITRWHHGIPDKQKLSGNTIYDLELDSRRQLWIATNGGLDRLDLLSNKLYHYTYSADDPHSLGKNSAITQLYRDSNDTLWVGSNNGLNRYNLAADHFDRFLYSESIGVNIQNNAIVTISEVKRGQIWVGYGGSGIATLDFNNDDTPGQINPVIGLLNTDSGLPTNNIFGIVPDHVGSIWISTASGLLQYLFDNQPMRRFGVREGLPGHEFNDSAYHSGRNTLIYFGTTHGLAILDPAQLTDNLSSERLLFTKAIIYQPEKRFSVPLLEQQSLTLDHHANAVKIHYSDLDYNNPKQTRYAYRFSQLGNNWIDIGNDNHVTLNQLSAGRSTFSLRSRTANSDWVQSKTLTLIVVPPWWRTIYAYTSYLIVTVMFGYRIYLKRQQIRQEKRQMHRQLKLFAEAFRNTSEGVMIMHHSRTIVAVNAAFSTITGYSEQEAIAAGTNIIHSSKHSRDFYEHIWKTLDEKKQWRGEIWQANKNGVDIAIEITISPVTNEEQQLSHFVGVFSDITERLHAEEELRKLAKYDSLTGLPNRTLLQDRLAHAIFHSRREQQKLALLFLDLDRFKQVNDSLGHNVGDLLLVSVAERIGSILKEDDTFARLGGDEFVIILEDIEDLSELTHTANQVIEALASPFSLTGYEVSTSTSIGIALFPDDGQTSQALLKNADTAMYHVKGRGRNNFQFYTESMNDQAFERLSIENELRRAIEKQQFVLHYQPRVDSADGTVPSVEALIRWQHPKKGLISPGYFIDIAEECGLIVAISEWAIKKACHQLKRWQDAGLSEVSMSVNLSPRLFIQYDLVSFIKQTLNEYQLPPGKLELEITEGVLMNDVESTIADLQLLNELGCHISVDDFGTGYSSLSYLHRFPVHTLKIDRSFITAIHQHRKGKALVDIIINLAQNLELDLVAEGVETWAQFEFLQQRTRMQIQGYYFSKPVDAETVMPLLLGKFDLGNTDNSHTVEQPLSH